mgnify:CR=1 FL=1
MIKYSFYQKNPASHYIYIDLFIDGIQQNELHLQLPSWRPGRYELGNFAKNIKRVDAFNQNNEALQYTKLSKDLWCVKTAGASSVKITYSYYAAELNAGACFADITQMYVNPVHCCMYIPDRMNEAHEVELKIPDNYLIACSLEKKGNTLRAENFEELADSPFIASASLKSDYYELNGIRFWIHFNGECRPLWPQFKEHFSAFTKKQIEFWNDAPFNEYHFLFQILPSKFYHGVEHTKNTVIAIGPGFSLNTGNTYEDVLGVSCHELFHAWNIKTVRPVEMQPYNYTKENYARTGYVYEGFTTYYGDKLLLSSAVFSQEQYLATLQERMQKHFHNYGRYNLSVADSSWDTWLDGYVPGTPYRKTSIYDEGNLVAFILDVKILEATANRQSLRDVCVLLYGRFGKPKKGYSENDILNLVNEVSGTDFTGFFNSYVNSASDYETPLVEALNYLGMELHKEAAHHDFENDFGFKVTDAQPFCRVSLVAPYSPAWKAGLFAGDDIIAVNNISVKNNFMQWFHYFNGGGAITLTISSSEQLRAIELQRDKKGQTWFFNPVIRFKKERTKAETAAFEAWIKW